MQQNHDSRLKIQFSSSKHSGGTNRAHQAQALCSSSETLSTDGRVVTPTHCSQGFRSQLCRHDRRAWEALHQTLSMAKHLLDWIPSTSCFRKSLQNSVIPWWKSRKWLLTLNNKIRDSLAWLMPSSAPLPGTHRVGREINTVRMPFGITALGTPHFTTGLTSHLHGFPRI